MKGIFSKLRMGALISLVVCLSAPAVIGCAGATPPSDCPKAEPSLSQSGIAWPEKLDHVSTPETYAEAVDELFDVAHLDKTFSTTLDETLESEFKANPSLRRFGPLMREFIGKYMNLSEFRKVMTRVYMTRFSELEIRQMVALRKSPLSQRLDAEQSNLGETGGKLMMEAVQAHLPELRQRIQAEMQTGEPEN